MATTSARLLLWSPRILGILVSLFVGMFAIDTFNEGKPFLQALADFAIHLIPAVLLLALVGASFRWEWIGGIAFIGLAVVYAATVAWLGRRAGGVVRMVIESGRNGPVRFAERKLAAD